jgi:hypothetical protein
MVRIEREKRTQFYKAMYKPREKGKKSKKASIVLLS